MLQCGAWPQHSQDRAGPSPTVRLGRDVLSAPNSGEVVVSANLDSEAVEQLELQVVVEDLTAVGEKQRSHSNLNKEGPGC